MPELRPAAAGDAPQVARLLYQSAPEVYDLYAGVRAVDLLQRAFRRRGNFASREVVTIALVDDRVAGVILDNAAARALYERAGFTETTRPPAAKAIGYARAVATSRTQAAAARSSTAPPA